MIDVSSAYYRCGDKNLLRLLSLVMVQLQTLELGQFTQASLATEVYTQRQESKVCMSESCSCLCVCMCACTGVHVRQERRGCD